MSLFSTPVITLLSRALDLTARRQAVVSQNIANVDTPGYRTRDIDFRQELQRALTAGQNTETSSMSRDVPGLIERPDGNNVNIDEEASNMLLYQRAYQAAAQAITVVNQMLEVALNMGGGR